MTIIEKFWDAQSERKRGVPHLSAAGRGMGAVTSPLFNRGICSLLPRHTLRNRSNPPIPNLKPSQNSKILAQICKWSRPLLIGTAPQTEFDATPRKQTTEKILTGARTHIRNSAKQHLSARRNPTFHSQNGPPEAPIAGRRSPSFLSRLPRVHLRRTKVSGWPSRFLPGSAENIECDVTSRKQTPTKFLPGATTALGDSAFQGFVCGEQFFVFVAQAGPEEAA